MNEEKIIKKKFSSANYSYFFPQEHLLNKLIHAFKIVDDINFLIDIYHHDEDYIHSV